MLLPEGPAVIAALIVGIHTDFQALVSHILWSQGSHLL